MRIVLTFVLNAVLNLALGLAIAALLGADDYGRFAIGSTVAVVLAMSLFDWLRLSATRFYGETHRLTDPGVRATLNGAYAGLAGLLLAGTGFALVLRLDCGLGPALLAAAALGGLSNGCFDFYAALARARFLDRIYATLVIVKNGLAFALGVGVSLIIRDPALALGATAFGALVALIPVHGALRDEAAGWSLARFARLRAFAYYGFPVIAANLVYQMVILANRSVAAGALGYAAAGQLSLATDLGLRLFLAVGSALDVLLFQLAVRADAEQGRTAAEAQLRRNVVTITAVLVLLAVGYAIAMPAFTAVLVPERYRADYALLSLILVPGILAFCLAQFALNPMFQVAGRTGPLLGAASVALAADGLGLMLLGRGGLVSIAAVHTVSLGLSAGAVALLALRKAAHRPALGDILRIAAAALLTAAAMWPARSITPAWLSLAVATASGGAAYGAALICLDLGGVRGAIGRRLRRRPGVGRVQPAA